MRTQRICSTTLLVACVSGVGCSTDRAPTDPVGLAPTSGSLELTIEETGARPDTDGYELLITLATQAGPLVRSMQQGGGSLVLADLPPGTHTLRIEGLAAHCSVTGRHPRAFTVEAGKTTPTTLGVLCPGPGAILVKTVTRGRDVAIGYTVSIRGESSQERSIGATDSLIVGEGDLPSGTTWTVELAGLPANCWVDRPLSQSLRNLRGATARLEYGIACIPRSSSIAFEFMGGIHISSESDAVLLNGFGFPSDWGLSLSPDGTRVVFSMVDPDAIDFVLAIATFGGTGFSLLTSHDGASFVGSQAWSPDGSRIVFSKRHGNSSEIYVINADGSGEVQLTFGGAWNTAPAWSPDGASIAFCRTVGDPDEDSPDIYRMNASDGSGITNVASAGCDPAWSPNGSRIAFTHAGDLAVIGADGSGLTTLHALDTTSQLGLSSPSWSPDGSQIAYASGSRGNRIWIVDFDGGVFGEPYLFRFGSAPSWK
jgi:Tol biopolymer transport system component